MNVTDLEEKKKAYREAQAICGKAEADYNKAREVMPERLAYSKAQTIRNLAWEAFIKAGG
ncbi:hypothetical protein LCGC14_0970700 [marine sediment metagenome]|uniref:Uncharacterized protein n=1 Tax=marine sediment metagenome TaxID=412755 RepID=A0A0F9RI54_9ZZZZ